jgi:hypothetical protein
LFGGALNVVRGHFIDLIDLGKQLAPVSVIRVVVGEQLGKPLIVIETADEAGSCTGFDARKSGIVDFGFLEIVQNRFQFLLILIQGVAQ